MQRRKLATYNPVTCVWETDDLCMGGHSELFSGTWPSSGMTRGGTAFELPTWAPRTGGSGFSSSPTHEGLLWTPVTTPERPQQGGDSSKWPASLHEQVVEELPTFAAGAADEPDVLLATPAVNDMGEGKTPEQWHEWNSGPTMAHQQHGTTPLSILAQELTRDPVSAGTPTHLLPTHMRNDPAYRSPESASRRAESGFTDLVSALAAEAAESSGLIPTPRAQVREVRDRGDGYRHNLEEWPAEMARGSSAPTSDPTAGASTAEPSLMSLLPTPTSSEAHGPGGYGPGHTGGENLATKAAGLLPTPDAYQGSRGGSQDPEKRRAGNHSVSLADVTEQGDLLPTPMTKNATSQKAKTGRPTSGPSRGGPSVGLEDVLLPTPTVGNASRRGNWKGGKDRSDELLLPGVAAAAAEGALLSTPKASNNENVCSESYSNLGTDLREVDPDLRLLGDGTGPRSDVGSES